uniref:Uncharacterized protein n=1 Tax=Hyaloperonospora arabidopsidis (strain Emoy2) TaxID=559515 RepID=M4BIG0_HYAAE
MLNAFLSSAINVAAAPCARFKKYLAADSYNKSGNRLCDDTLVLKGRCRFKSFLSLIHFAFTASGPSHVESMELPRRQGLYGFGSHHIVQLHSSVR